MGKVNPEAMKDWRDGDVVYAQDYKREREILRTAINDNFDRLIKRFVVKNASGQTKTTANLDTALNYLQFQEGANVILDMDASTATLKISVSYGSGSVPTAALADGSVTTVKVANSAITEIKIANGAVTTNKLADGAVTTGKIADNAVNTAKIANNSVTEQKIANNSITSDKIVDQSVTASKLANNSVTTRAVADRSITEAKIQQGALDNRYYTKPETHSLLNQKTDVFGDHKGTWQGLRVEDIDPEGFDAARITAIERQLNEDQIRSAELIRGIQVVETDQATPLRINQIKGRTLVNLLGDYGNCESIEPFTISIGPAENQFSVDTSYKVYGEASVKVVPSNDRPFYKGIPVNLQAGKCYLLAGEFRGSNMEIQFRVAARQKDSGYHLGNAYVSHTLNKLSYLTFIATEEEYSAGFLINNGDGSSYVNVDGLRLYEITEAEKMYIDSLPMTVAEDYIAKTYPFVESLKNLSGVYVKRYGKNLSPALDGWELGGFGSNGVLSDRTDRIRTNRFIKVASGTTIFASVAEGYEVSFWAYNQDGFGLYFIPFGSVISDELNGDVAYIKPTVRRVDGANMDVIRDYGSAKIMINIGTEALPFEEQNNDYLYADVELASNQNGSVADMLEYRDGRYWKVRKYNYVILDGNLDWRYVSRTTGTNGSVTVKAPLKYVGITDSQVGIKYDGSILKNWEDYQTYSGGNIIRLIFREVYVSISRIDSGWGDDYTPTPEEIKAYFMGWRMFAGGDPSLPPYNGTGTKQWGKIYCGVGSNNNGIVTGSGTTTLPTEMNDMGYTPYKLQYELEEPVFEDVTDKVFGSVSLYEGVNLIEVGEGVVVREVAKTSYNDSIHYIINHATRSPLNNRAWKILEVYKDGSLDDGWEFFEGASSTSFGRAWARKPIALFDPNATYTVTYIAERYAYSASIQSIDVQYSTNIKTVVDRTVQDVADLTTRVSEFPSIYARKHQEPWIEPTLLNGWSGVARYYKDELGTVHVTCDLSGGIANSGVVLFVLPEGYRPDISPSRRFVAFTNTNAPMPDIAFVRVNDDGRVSIASSEFKNPTFAFSISFRAR